MAGKSPGDCVVLVPVGGAIEPGCEAGLRTLEDRGYTVRRVRGFSQIDVGRSQLATDALRDGFRELIWIDSDVVFDPNDVERLRDHELPFVCGIYAKKSRREFACHFLPESESVTFGANGGLTEILYAGFGFVHTRHSLYTAIQEASDLPECNAGFGSALVPYFMPIAIPHGKNHWYLGEDYAFCERARRAGFRIMLDTRIRLWHVGSYQFGWEDAGSDKERFGSYTFFMKKSEPTIVAPVRHDEAQRSAAIHQLSGQHPWPMEKPKVAVPPNDGWLYPSVRKMLSDAVSSQTRVVLELGSWTGLSTRYLADHAENAKIIAVDHWKGSPEHVSDPNVAPRLEQLYEEFLSACWDYRDRIIPIRATTDEGMCAIRELGIIPDLIYLDADHSYDSVVADIALANHLFPDSLLVGDDWDWQSVRRAVTESSLEHNRQLTTVGTAWKLDVRRT